MKINGAAAVASPSDIRDAMSTSWPPVSQPRVGCSAEFTVKLLDQLHEEQNRASSYRPEAARPAGGACDLASLDEAEQLRRQAHSSAIETLLGSAACLISGCRSCGATERGFIFRNGLG